MSISSPEAVAQQLRDRPGFVWLDGGNDGWHVLSWDPDETLTTAEGWPEHARELAGEAQQGDGPFTSGVLGYVGYGAGSAVETVPAQLPTPEPPVWLGRYSHSACYRKGRWVLHGDRPFRQEAELLLRAPLVAPAPPPHRPHRTPPRADYLAGVREILAWIAAGDCYQVNLSRPVFVDLPDPFATYQRLRRASDAAMGAWMTLTDELRVLSNSPEVLLEVRQRKLLSDPIKGTRPRGRTLAEDARQRRELLESAKDHAELAMIVDLVRNDLGKVARPGSVRADKREVRSHAYVHHANWPVSAELAAGRDGWDALAALFPPGSVTGAPKVRATERIEELERTPRGVYCGSIGFADNRGIAHWSVAIRTAVWSAGTLRYHLGGGVVADSDPEAEWDETVHKGRMLAAASGVFEG